MSFAFADCGCFVDYDTVIALGEEKFSICPNCYREREEEE